MISANIIKSLNQNQTMTDVNNYTIYLITIGIATVVNASSLKIGTIRTMVYIYISIMVITKIIIQNKNRYHRNMSMIKMYTILRNNDEPKNEPNKR